MADSGAASRVFTVPNIISFLRLCLIPVFVWAFATERDVAALVLMFFIGISDFLDGVVARRFGQVSELGKLLDPLSDRVAIVASMVALVLRDLVPLWLAAVILARDAAVAVVFPVLEKKGYPRIAVNDAGKAATMSIFLGMGFAILSVVFADFENLARTVSIVLLVVGATLYWVAAALYVVEIRRHAGLRDPVGGGASRPPR